MNRWDVHTSYTVYAHVTNNRVITSEKKGSLHAPLGRENTCRQYNTKKAGRTFDRATADSRNSRHGFVEIVEKPTVETAIPTNAK